MPPVRSGVREARLLTKTAPSDGELLDQWVSGDHQAGHLLCQRHWGTVRRFFGNRASTDAEDLTQQTFLACVEAKTRYRGEASFKTFLLAIARNQLFGHYRRSVQRRELDLAEPLALERAISQVDILARREDEQELKRALRSVPPDMQVTVELAYGQGLGAPEIAEQLAIPINTAYTRLYRMRKLLRERIAVERSRSEQGEVGCSTRPRSRAASRARRT
jgi:RNA polymerase sigma factor (sigma-70 family)